MPRYMVERNFPQGLSSLRLNENTGRCFATDASTHRQSSPRQAPQRQRTDGPQRA